jgi:hypothetical protein
VAVVQQSSRVPISQPVLLGDARIANTAWAAWFQDVANQLQRMVPSWRSGQKIIYASDAAAAAGGVVLGGLYFDGVQVRARLV